MITPYKKKDRTLNKTRDKKIKATFYLNEREADRLRAIAKAKGVPQSEYLRSIINNSYRQLKHKTGLKTE